MSQGPEGRKDLWSRLGQTIRSGAETLVQETKELTRMGKYRVELMSLENERNRKFEDIGRSAHTLYKGGVTFPPELGELFAAVDLVERRIDEKRQEIENLRVAETKPEPQPAEEATFCPQCGAKIDQGDVFCSKCGTRVV
ncbi:MAG: zinc ribbon domain-containing protein [Bacillota bacterium]